MFNLDQDMMPRCIPSSIQVPGQSNLNATSSLLMLIIMVSSRYTPTREVAATTVREAVVSCHRLLPSAGLGLLAACLVTVSTVYLGFWTRLLIVT